MFLSIQQRTDQHWQQHKWWSFLLCNNWRKPFRKGMWNVSSAPFHIISCGTWVLPIQKCKLKLYHAKKKPNVYTIQKHWTHLKWSEAKGESCSLIIHSSIIHTRVLSRITGICWSVSQLKGRGTPWTGQKRTEDRRGYEMHDLSAFKKKQKTILLFLLVNKTHSNNLIFLWVVLIYNSASIIWDIICDINLLSCHIARCKPFVEASKVALPRCQRKKIPQNARSSELHTFLIVTRWLPALLHFTFSWDLLKYFSVDWSSDSDCELSFRLAPPPPTGSSARLVFIALHANLIKRWRWSRWHLEN